MNTPGTAGEPSCKRQENGDGSTGSERPLKKARFAWQVKGNKKYQLKNESSEASTTSSTLSEPETSSFSQTESSAHDLVGNTEQNLEILGDYLLKQDFNTLDSVITDSEKSLLKPCTSVSTERQEYPKYVGSYDKSMSTNRDEHMSVAMSMVASQDYNEDQCIARWQARQMAKGFVDNTINRVLDSWMVQPLPANMDNRFLALDVAEFINNLPGDNSIENEGILMAISAHGLQNTSSSTSSNESSKDDSSTKPNVFPSRSSSPLQSEDETDQMINNKSDPNIDSSDLQIDWSDGGNDAFSLRPVSSTYLSYVDNDQLHATNFENDNANSDYTDHYNFMDAAVTFAIQNKGLTSFGTDYG